MDETEIAWEDHSGERVTVHAMPGSRAVSEAPRELRLAEQGAEALEDLLDLPRELRGQRLDIYLVESPSSIPDQPQPSGGGGFVGEAGLVRLVQDGPGDEPLARPLTQFLCAKWFGPQAAEAAPFIEGLGGLVAARTGTGPSVEMAHTWVREQLAAGRPVSVLPGAPSLSSGGSQGEGGAMAGGPGEAMAAGGPGEAMAAGGPGEAMAAGGPGEAMAAGGGPGEAMAAGGPGEAMPGGPSAGAAAGDPAGGPGVFAGGGPASDMASAGPGPGDTGGPGLASSEDGGGGAAAAGPAGTGGQPPSGPTPDEAMQPSGQGMLASLSFVASLLDQRGPAPLRRVLKEFDPSRRDQAIIAAYERPLGALLEEWSKSMGRVQKKHGLGSLLRYVFPHLRPLWLRQAEVFVYMILAAVFSVLSLPIAIGAVIGALSGPSPDTNEAGPLGAILGDVQTWLREPDEKSKIMIFALILVLIYLIQAAITIRRSVAGEIVAQRLLMSVQEKTFAHVLRLPHSFYADANVGDLMTRLSSDVNTVASAMTGVLNQGLFLGITLLTAAGSVMTLNLRLGLAMLVVVPLFLLTYRTLSGRLATASFEQMTQMGDAASVTQETLSAHAVIKAFGMDDRVRASYRSRLMAIMRTALRMSRLQGLFEASSEMFITLAQIIIVAYGGFLVLDGQLELGVLVSFIAIVPNLLLPLAGFTSMGEMIQMASGSMARVTEILDRSIPIEDAADAKPLDPLRQQIRLENVTFGYSPEKVTLQDLSVSIRAGENVAIVGPSGSGKSTVINLVLRFWDPWDGRITIDGRDIRTATLDSLRGQMGLVFQETFVFNTTVRDNIAIGRPDASDEEISAAARAAQLEEWIESLPGRYDTVLGERGVRMSGGQRQRLAIARVLLRNPAVMILDEATSALDAETEAEILETLDMAARGRTTIAITHRLSMAARADRVLVIQKGRLVEEGHHSELVRAGGLYQTLYEAQVASAMELAEEGSGPTRSGESAVAAGLDVGQLREVPIFAGLSEQDLAQMAGRLRPERFGPGQVVVRQGDRGDRLFVIGSGQADVVLDDEAGERHLATLTGGDYFGEMALLTDRPRQATVRTTIPSELFSLSREDFLSFLEEHAEVRESIEGSMAKRTAALAAATAAAGAPATPSSQ